MRRDTGIGMDLTLVRTLLPVEVCRVRHIDDLIIAGRSVTCRRRSCRQPSGKLCNAAVPLCNKLAASRKYLHRRGDSNRFYCDRGHQLLTATESGRLLQGCHVARMAVSRNK